MTRALVSAAVLALSVAVLGQPTLKISFGTRETGFAGSTVGTIGANGGTTGGIEWIGLDVQTLVLNGTWQLFSFDMDQASVTAFAGASANGILEGLYGTLEHIRMKSEGFSGIVDLWIDDVADTVAAGPNVFGTFEGYAAGTEVMFQEPRFSGSTAANLALLPNFAGVDTTVAHSGSNSYHVSFQFVDGSPTRWLRLTSFNTPNQPNPVIRYDQDSVVSFWMRGVPEPASMAAMAFGLVALALRKRKR